MFAGWTIWLTTRSEQGALKVLARVQQALGRDLQRKIVAPYVKTNSFTLSFLVHLESTTWNDAFVEALALSEHIGYQWTIYGSLEHDIHLMATHAYLPGITMMQYWLFPDDYLSTKFNVGETVMIATEHPEQQLLSRSAAVVRGKLKHFNGEWMYTVSLLSDGAIAVFPESDLRSIDK